MSLMRSLNLDYSMNNKKIYEYIRETRLLLDKIESELSYPGEYSLEGVNYQDVVWYYQNNTDDL